MKKTLCALLSIAMVFSLSTVCFAADYVAPVKDEILGTLSDDEGSPEYFAKEKRVPTLRSSNTLFSLRAARVYDLLTTYSADDKYVTKSMLSGDDYVKVSGTLTYSPTPGYSDAFSRGGLCYYDLGDGIFETNPCKYVEFDDGEYTSGKISKKELSQDKTYYGFVKNLANDSDEEYFKLSGTLKFSRA